MLVLEKLRKHKFALAALLLPLVIRLVPEVIAGPYPIGYDSIAAYVPLMRDWSAGNIAYQFNPLQGGWIIFALFGLAYSVTRIDPVFIVKAAGPILYGFLGLSEYVFSRHYLKWTPRRSLLLVAIASIYFVSLRISLDLLRNTLGTIFLFLALSVGKDLRSKPAIIGASALTLLTTMAHLLVGTLLLALIVLEAIHAESGKFRRLIVATPAAILVSLSVFQFQLAGSQIVSLGNQTFRPIEAYALAAYIFVPLIPVAIFGARSLKSNLMKSWIVVCLAGIVASTAPVALSSQLVWPDRWALMMSFPLAVYSTQGFLQLRRRDLPLRFRGMMLGRIWISVLIILACTYMTLPADRAFSYYHFFQPTSMLQSTIPVENSHDMISAFQWLSTNADPTSAVITTDSTYGWAREYFTGRATILRLFFGATIQDGLSRASISYSVLYTVWWANQDNQYGGYSVPPVFSLAHSVGSFAVYAYTK